MRIAFFNDAIPVGGGELWVLRACRHLAAMGHKVTVVCPWRSEMYSRCLAEGIDVFAFLRMSGIPLYEPMFHALRRRDIDVLYCTVIGAFCEATMLGAMIDRINVERPQRPAVLVLKTGLAPMRGLTPEYYGAGAGPAVARLHVVSERTRQAFLQWCPELAPDFVEVVAEGVDLDRFDAARESRAVARQRLGLAPDDQVVTTIARLSPMKGVDNVLLAAPRVLERHTQARFLIAGEGDQRARLESLRDRQGLRDRVHFVGHTDDVPSLLAATDVLCHPSLADGMPNAIIEALAAGTPVVASDVGGIPEVITDGQSGLLVPPADLGRLAAGINRLLDRPRTAARLASNGRRAVREHFDLARNVEHLVDRLEHECEEAVRAHAARRRVRPKLRSRSQPSRPAPLDVLFLMNGVRVGGEETELRILARHLDRKHFRLHVVSLFPVDDPEMVARLQAEGLAVDTRCHELPDEAKATHVRNLIRHARIRVTVACQDTRIAYRVFEELHPAECTLVEHGGVVTEVDAIPKGRTTRYVGVSRAIQAAAAALMDDPDDAVCLPSMVDTGEYAALDRTAIRRAYGLGADDCVVTFVGRLDPKKRVEDLLEALAAVLPHYQNVHGIVVGGPDAFQPAYAAQLRELYGRRFGSRVIFAGSRGDVPQILTASDILVLPATGEGMSHVIAEAGAAGLAVIAVDDGAAREQLDDGAAGRLVPPRRPDLLAGELVELIAKPELRRRLGRRLRARVQAEFSARRIVPQWEALLNEVAAPGLAPHELMIATWDRPLEFPAEIQIQTITSCNASCVMCPYPKVSTEFPHERMDERLYERILDECAHEPRLRRIEPFLMNEAFTDNRVIDWIARAKERVPQAMVTVTTNGSPLIPKITDRLIRTGLDAIWFSFNGATPETYERIMGISYDRVKANIDYLLEVRPPSLRVFVNMIETRLMAPEIAENIRYWTSRGVQAGASPLVNRAGNVENFEELRYTPQGFQPVRTCELVFYKMYILASGDVVLCCMDWRRQVVLGNVGRQSLREIWNGEAYRQIRRQHIEGRDGEIDLCKSCSYTLS